MPTNTSHQEVLTLRQKVGVVHQVLVVSRQKVVVGTALWCGPLELVINHQDLVSYPKSGRLTQRRKGASEIL